MENALLAKYMETMAWAVDALHEPTYQANYPRIQRIGEAGGQ
jgi:hypothetical protein